MSENLLASVVAELEADALEGGEHPSPGVLIDYQAGKLSDEADLRVAEHLAFCAECAGVVLDLTAGPNLAPSESAKARQAAEVEEDWLAIRRQLGGAESPSQDPPALLPFKAREEKKELFPQWGLGQLAAILALAVLGLSWQVLSLSRRLDAPQANVFVADLEPSSEGASRERGAAIMEVPAGSELVVFLLVQHDLRPFERYSAELLGRGGEVLWQNEGLQPAKEGGFSLAVPLAGLPFGDLEIRLFGQNGAQREKIATYRTHLGRAAKMAPPAS